LAGHGIYRLPEGEFTVRRGDFLLIEPLAHIFWRVPAQKGPWEVVWFFLPPELLPVQRSLPQISEGYRLHSITRPLVFRQVRLALLRAHGYAARHRPLYQPLALNAVEEACLWCRTETDGAHPPRDPRIETALQYLSSHLDQPVRIRDVAGACGASRTRLLTLFRRQVGTSLMQYLEEQRMRRAKQLLKTGMMRVKEVAMEVGYTDQKYFAKRFKRAFGRRPIQCRP
jgi:AraC family transcriptional regulator, arabinose operon regulatory protein